MQQRYVSIWVHHLNAAFFLLSVVCGVRRPSAAVVMHCLRLFFIPGAPAVPPVNHLDVTPSWRVIHIPASNIYFGCILSLSAKSDRLISCFWASPEMSLYSHFWCLIVEFVEYFLRIGPYWVWTVSMLRSSSGRSQGKTRTPKELVYCSIRWTNRSV